MFEPQRSQSIHKKISIFKSYIFSCGFICNFNYLIRDQDILCGLLQRNVIYPHDYYFLTHLSHQSTKHLKTLLCVFLVLCFFFFYFTHLGSALKIKLPQPDVADPAISIDSSASWVTKSRLLWMSPLVLQF